LASDVYTYIHICRSVAKRVTSLQISEDEQYLLTADKTGTVTRYRLSDISCDGEEMMGHLSMILDMVMVSHDSHVITCDRDEKIRVSRYPNCYNIETYCLGHTEFVSCLCLCEKWPHLLVSASGDGTVRSWEWRNGRLLDTHHFSEDGQDPVTVTQVVCSRNMEQPLIVATVEG
ncbi:tRNA (guanine-N(7)-)-methyltransferase non-catalytic subunit wdr4, partial [Geodia barretti]